MHARMHGSLSPVKYGYGCIATLILVITIYQCPDAISRIYCAIEVGSEVQASQLMSSALYSVRVR
ncbi:hypothetical protein BDV38DRAFT_251675 [Aspergillus pseudotamarii]|uniref:Uncharacterized protein n=1 Tax=Aspergillus pseudotamarii TaxID=132259 RepID=A0A5N6SPF9_ASPPS|nr:uncharacterized protein BDV38DRAFT_251675 [Aspergillus pseudotamarii]KAE8135611.1 hypothetical protein BDV38DRAFT_251675 [Aspergillus pseudotamarii]